MSNDVDNEIFTIIIIHKIKERDFVPCVFFIASTAKIGTRANDCYRNSLILTITAIIQTGA